LYARNPTVPAARRARGEGSGVVAKRGSSLIVLQQPAKRLTADDIILAEIADRYDPLVEAIP